MKYAKNAKQMTASITATEAEITSLDIVCLRIKSRDNIEYTNPPISISDEHNQIITFRILDFLPNLKLTYSGNAIHARIKIASYPVSKENALKVAYKLFDFL